jgi:DNA polymerase III alpha subunit
MNRITENIPGKEEISDQLQEMIEEGQEPSIVLWALQNHGRELSEWCTLSDKGEFTGPYARYFQQAIRLEGCRNGQSKHASAVCISGEPIQDYLPLIRDKSSDNLLVGFEGVDMESAGGPKFDQLSTKVLQVIMDTCNTVARDSSYAD